MFEKPGKFGTILVRKEVISSEQLAAVLEVQKNSNKEFGILVSEMFSIPEELIESLYASEVLEPSIKMSLLLDLIKKFESSSIDPVAVLNDIEVTVAEFSTHLSVTTSYSQKGASAHRFSIESRSGQLQRISGVLEKVELKLKSTGPGLPFSTIPFEFILNKQELIFGNPGFISEVRFKLLQAVKLAQ